MQTAETKRLSPTAVGVILFSLIILAFFLYRAFNRDAVEIRVAAVSHQTLLSTISSTGKIEPIEPFQAHAPTPGVVEQVLVQVGQKIKEGQLLVKLDDSDAVARLATAKATLRSAEVAAQNTDLNGSQEERNLMVGDLGRAQMQQQQATRDVAALRQLQAKGAASAAEVYAAEQRLQSANSIIQGLQQRGTNRYSSGERDRAKADVENARAAVAAAQSSYANVNIRSPLAGTVYNIPVATYDFVPAGEDLMDVADLNHIQIRAYFDEPEIGKLAVGQSVKIIWDAKPGIAWHGHIIRSPSTVISSGTRNVGECIISVDDAQGDLLPNTNVNVTVTYSQRFNALSIPREAIHPDGSGYFVFRVVNNKLVRTPVQVGLINLTRVEILGGLIEKDTVALSAANSIRELTNGLSIKIVE